MKKKQAVKEILKKQDITSWFQAIMDIETNNLFGWEAFSRGPITGPHEDTPSLFDYVSEAGLMKPFDLMCIHNAAMHFEQLQLNKLLFVNFSNEMLLAISRLKEQVGNLIVESKVSPTQMVVEIDERKASQNVDELIEAVHFFHEQGFLIAIDDLVDNVDSARKLWTELKPDFVKIDRCFIENIDKDNENQKFVQEIVAIARSVKAKVIAEGVETNEELKTLQELGIHLMQGYLIHKPELSPVPPKHEELSYSSPITSSTNLACDLVVFRDKISPEMPIEDVLSLLEKRVSISSIAVVNDDEQVLGMIYRNTIMTKLSSRQRREVVQKKPISSEMDPRFLDIDSHLRLEQVSHLLTAKNRVYTEQDFVITNQGKFLGIGTTIDLLRKITQLRVDPYHQLNLISMLPGNTPIGDCVNRLLDKGVEFTIGLLDLTRFKPFNNRHGHQKGDELLVILANLLRKHFDQDCDFSGHIGGDDFVVVSQNKDWKESLSSLMSEFDNRVTSFYTSAEQESGGIHSTDRYGKDKFFSFVNVTGGLMSVTDEYFDSFQTLLSDLIELKQLTKKDDSLRIAHRHKEKTSLITLVEGKFEYAEL